MAKEIFFMSRGQRKDRITLKKMMDKVINWLNGKLKNGFYFPVIAKYVIPLLQKLSLNYHFKKYVRKLTLSEKTPHWVSELYQVVFLIGGFLLRQFNEEVQHLGLRRSYPKCLWRDDISNLIWKRGSG
ncbi:MAG: hypothetical protein HY805_01690 [Nitrospirae bacterium]|nr:hypothetical protein [Nitrospirota bacterium]